MSNAEKIGLMIGGLFATYFVIYPIIYFAWNFFIEGIGYANYQIPNFWIGMVGYLLFNLIKNILGFKRIFNYV